MYLWICDLKKMIYSKTKIYNLRYNKKKKYFQIIIELLQFKSEY